MARFLQANEALQLSQRSCSQGWHEQSMAYRENEHTAGYITDSSTIVSGCEYVMGERDMTKYNVTKKNYVAVRTGTVIIIKHRTEI